MRTFAVTLAVNNGTGELGATLDVTAARISLGTWKWEADEQLTKLTPGSLDIPLADPDGTIWTWLQTQIQTAAGILPPWITVDVDGVRAFTGTVDLARLTRDRKCGEIRITALDWSAQLGAQTLGAARPEDDLNPALNPWLRPYPLAATNRIPTETRSATVQWRSSDWISGNLPNNWLKVGDVLTCARISGAEFKIAEIKEVNGYWMARLPGLLSAYVAAVHPRNPGLPGDTSWQVDWQADFTRGARITESKTYYQVRTAVPSNPDPACYQIELDTVAGLVAGDQVELIQSAKSKSWTILQVDPSSSLVVTRESVDNLAQGDRIFLSQESLSELVYVDARSVLRQAAQPYTVNLDRFTPPTLPSPVLTWLPLRPAKGADLTAIKDLDARGTQVRVHGVKAIWEGTPEAGWSPASTGGALAAWTGQLQAAPASMMPEESLSLTPTAPRRNRPAESKWQTWPKVQLTTDDIEVWAPDAWNPRDAALPGDFLLYDYLSMRRLRFSGNSIAITPWSGSAWGTTTTVTWTGGPAKSACVLAGQPGYIVVRTSAGIYVMALPSGALSGVISLPADAGDGVLVSTPWGSYLVGSRGYGRLSSISGTSGLTFQWASLADEATQLYANTFAAIDADQIFVMARMDAQDREGKVVTETHAIRLAATPTTPDVSVLGHERVLEGAPRTLGAIRDPSTSGRVIGHCGGGLFQVSRTLPQGYALERFKPSGMRASELIEHICQVMLAVALPAPDGTLHVVSRAAMGTPQDLPIPAMQVVDTRLWEHHYSYVRVSGSEQGMYVDAPAEGEATVQGGKLLEVSSHPLLWTRSGCEAMARALHAWFSVPRRKQTQKWVWPDPNTAAPWEALPPLALVRVNGDPTVWIIYAVEDSKTTGEANVTLIEVP